MTDSPEGGAGTAAADVLHTTCGRTLTLGRIRLDGLEHPTSRVTLDLHREPYDSEEVWASLTPVEARTLAGRLLAHAAAAERESAGPAAAPGNAMEVRYLAGESYAVTVRGHEFLTDQPADLHGQDSAATPTELFVASLASCVAFYAGRYLARHGLSRDGLRVAAEYEMAGDRPARVSSVRMSLSVTPDLPERRRAGLLAVASHCTVHNTLRQEPDVRIELS